MDEKSCETFLLCDPGRTSNELDVQNEWEENSHTHTLVHVLLLYVCVCTVIPFILDVRFVNVPTEVTQKEGHTGFLHLSSAVLALIFISRRIQPPLSLVDRKVEFCVPTI